MNWLPFTTKTRQILAARELSEEFLLEELATSPANGLTRTDFLRIWNSQICSTEVQEIEALASWRSTVVTRVIFSNAANGQKRSTSVPAKVGLWRC